MISLSGQRGSIIGIASDLAVAVGCARAFAARGAILAASYLDETAGPRVRAMTATRDCPPVRPCGVRVRGASDAVFDMIAQRWGRRDFLPRLRAA